MSNLFSIFSPLSLSLFVELQLIQGIKKKLYDNVKRKLKSEFIFPDTLEDFIGQLQQEAKLAFAQAKWAVEGHKSLSQREN